MRKFKIFIFFWYKTKSFLTNFVPSCITTLSPIIAFLITTFEPITQFLPILTLCSIIVFEPINEFLPIFTFLPIKTLLPNLTDLIFFCTAFYR